MPPEIRLGNPITPIGTQQGASFVLPRITRQMAEDAMAIRELEQQDEVLAERKRQFNLGQMSDLYSDFQNRAIQQKRIDAILEREDLRYKREGVRQRGLLERLGETQDRIDTRTRETREAIAAQMRATQTAIGDRAAAKFKREARLKFEADVDERSRGRLTGEQAMQIAQESGLNTGEVVRRYGRGQTHDFNDANKAIIKGVETDLRAVQADQNFNDSDKQTAFNGLRQKVAGINKEWIEAKFDADGQLDAMSSKSPYGDIVIWKADPKNPGQHIIDKIMSPPDIGDISDEAKQAFRARESATRAVLGSFGGTAQFIGKDDDPETAARKITEGIDAIADNMLRYAKSRSEGDTGKTEKPIVVPTTPEEAEKVFLKIVGDYPDGNYPPDIQDLLADLMSKGLLSISNANNSGR